MLTHFRLKSLRTGRTLDDYKKREGTTDKRAVLTDFISSMILRTHTLDDQTTRLTFVVTIPQKRGLTLCHVVFCTKRRG